MSLLKLTNITPLTTIPKNILIQKRRSDIAVAIQLIQNI